MQWYNACTHYPGDGRGYRMCAECGAFDGTCGVASFASILFPQDIFLIIAGVLLVGALAIFIFVPSHLVAGDYFKETEQDAHRLLRSESPDPREINQTIGDLRRFPKSEEARDLIEALMRKRAGLQVTWEYE